MLECARIVVYSFVESAPPYYAFGLFVLDFSNFGLAWIAAITYGYKIAPPNLAATMASIVNMMQYVLGWYCKMYFCWARIYFMDYLGCHELSNLRWTE